jgi:hypothetical protein
MFLLQHSTNVQSCEQTRALSKLRISLPVPIFVLPSCLRRVISLILSRCQGLEVRTIYGLLGKCISCSAAHVSVPCGQCGQSFHQHNARLPLWHWHSGDISDTEYKFKFSAFAVRGGIVPTSSVRKYSCSLLQMAVRTMLRR